MPRLLTLARTTDVPRTILASDSLALIALERYEWSSFPCISTVGPKGCRNSFADSLKVGLAYLSHTTASPIPHGVQIHCTTDWLSGVAGKCRGENDERRLISNIMFRRCSLRCVSTFKWVYCKYVHSFWGEVKK